MRVREWMSTNPLTVTSDVSVREARGLMRGRGVRHLPVLDEGKVTGMLSDRDVRIPEGQLEETDDLDHALGATRTAADVMSAPVHVIHQDAPIEDAARTMLSRRISALPVVDDAGDLAGLITTTDCLLAFLSPQAERAPEAG